MPGEGRGGGRPRGGGDAEEEEDDAEEEEDEEEEEEDDTEEEKGQHQGGRSAEGRRLWISTPVLQGPLRAADCASLLQPIVVR